MMIKKITAMLLVLVVTSSFLSACKPQEKNQLDAKNPVTIEVWHYYNSTQKSAFDSLVAEFNDTVGRETGIIVEALNHGNVSELTASVVDSANNKVGSAPIPNIFAAYADTAYQIDKLGKVAQLDDYLTPEEIAEYIPAYIEEGRLGGDNKLKIFPTAKTTEIFMLNKTDWDQFAAATGASVDALTTMEGLVKTAEAYYIWTDSLTPDKVDDGKAFFGRDAMANYFIIGCKQFGIDIFSVDANGKVTFQLDEKILKLLWDHYYVPFINGYFAANGRFRSDDAKVGDVIALVGSTTSATFFPSTVILNETTSYDIEVVSTVAPCFEQGEPYAVQQGAGMVVTKSTPEEELASTLFLKWFTQAERNIQFSTMSCYMPVKVAANDPTLFHKAIAETKNNDFTDVLKQSLEVSIATTVTHKLYTNQAFDGGTEARKVLEFSLSDKANADAASVQQLVDGGMSRKDAAAQINTPQNFESWLAQLKQELDATQKG